MWLFFFYTGSTFVIKLKLLFHIYLNHSDLENSLYDFHQIIESQRPLTWFSANLNHIQGEGKG